MPVALRLYASHSARSATGRVAVRAKKCRTSSTAASPPHTGASVGRSVAVALSCASARSLRPRLTELADRVVEVACEQRLELERTAVRRRETRAKTAIDHCRQSTATSSAAQDVAHSVVTQTAEPFDQCCECDALDGVEVDRASSRDRIVTRFEQNFTGQPAHGGRARCDQASAQPGNRGVARQHHYRTSADLFEFTPPEFAAARFVGHDAAAASRNDARSPHSSPRRSVSVVGRVARVDLGGSMACDQCAERRIEQRAIRRATAKPAGLLQERFVDRGAHAYPGHGISMPWLWHSEFQMSHVQVEQQRDQFSSTSVSASSPCIGAQSYGSTTAGRTWSGGSRQCRQP